MPRTHVIGAGLAGLATAVSLVRRGRDVTLYEAGGHAGGRCRSYADAKLDRTIDNGNHLLLSGNRAAMRYLADIEAADSLIGPASACFPFLDLRTGQRWLLRPNAGRLPWWILHSGRRVPDTRVWNYLSALRFVTAGADATVTDCVGETGALFERFWKPLAVGALNTPARSGAARLLWSVLRETFARGEAACRPRIAKTGLSAAFVDPALKFLHQRGATVRFGRRLRRISYRGRRANGLDFGSERIRLREGGSVVLAVPPLAAAELVPGLSVPGETHAIVNAHFRLSKPAGMPPKLPLLGLIGGTAQWLFIRGDVASVTVSAADALAGEPAEVIARRSWNDVAAALGQERERIPRCRIVKEKRATFAQTPGQVKRRPPTGSEFANLFLAGDWIDTGLPATIESAVRSGQMAARVIAESGTPGAARP
ncbi:MAG: hydroxysqualene dehydroxylase HpnE [Acidobacteriota bacterium]|nr:hydroxysqualene dehydroxylase HpnE [Acidobacteriota bacterium]